jgi:hypothetical protein
MRTLYFADFGGTPYSSEAECLAAEAKERERQEYWRTHHDPRTKLEQLKAQLDAAMNIDPRTIATCSFDSLQVKGLVRVCQAFAETNKQYLDYY